MSEAHKDALNHHLRTAGNRHEDSHAPANPARFISRSTKDVADEPLRLTPEQRKHYERREREGKKTMEGKNHGAFARLQADLAAAQAGGTMEKAQPKPFNHESDLDQAALIKSLRSVKVAPTAGDALAKPIQSAKAAMAKALSVEHQAAAPAVAHKPAAINVTRDQVIAATSAAFADGTLSKAQALVIESSVNRGDVSEDMFKAIGRHLEKLLKSDAPTGSASLEASYDTNAVGKTGGAAIQKQSLQKGKRTSDEVQARASECLKAGKITGAQANHIATHCAMGMDVPNDLLKALGYDDE